MRRFVIAVATASALVVPTSVAVVGSSAPAWAASSIQCSKLSGTASTNATISKCSPKSKTNKSASAPAISLATGGTLTWSTSGQTTVVQLTVSSPGQGGCKAKSTEEDASGSVTGGTSTYTHVGDTVSVRACVASKGSKLSLVPGTTAAL